MNYQFEAERISQHIVKYGVTLKPPMSLEQDRGELQDYCNWLVQQFPDVFETLLSGPRQMRVQRTFLLPDGKRVELPTFVLAGSGPVFTFPRRLFIDRAHELDIAERDKIFLAALQELRSRFGDRSVLRVGVVSELVFDTGSIDSLAIVSSNLKSDLWRDRTQNLRLFMEIPTEDKNVNIELRPTHLRRFQQGGDVTAGDNKFGLIVNVDINNRQMGEDLTEPTVRDVLAFADEFVPGELVKFLNSEY